jgi:hypothetical protein
MEHLPPAAGKGENMGVKLLHGFKNYATFAPTKISMQCSYNDFIDFTSIGTRVAGLSELVLTKIK